MQPILNTFAAEMKNEEARKELIPWIGKTGKMLIVFLNNRLIEHGIGLTAKQWILLSVLHRGDGKPQQELALITERNKGTLVRLINTMEDLDLVKRIEDQTDRRVKRIFLTDRGRKKYASALPIVEQAYSELQQGLSMAEIKQLIGTLAKVMENIKNHSFIH
ncbi:MAG: MarR family transcriptional regulator [Saprospiraceae bacterium]|nr:MarR family transcriptional regulator [Saprospiraceae bacterium]